MSATLTEQIAELKRELALRKNVYPSFVKSGRMKQVDADRQTERLTAALHTLMAVERSPEAREKLNFLPGDA